MRLSNRATYLQNIRDTRKRSRFRLVDTDRRLSMDPSDNLFPRRGSVSSHRRGWSRVFPSSCSTNTAGIHSVHSPIDRSRCHMGNKVPYPDATRGSVCAENNILVGRRLQGKKEECVTTLSLNHFWLENLTNAIFQGFRVHPLRGSVFRTRHTRQRSGRVLVLAERTGLAGPGGRIVKSARETFN